MAFSLSEAGERVEAHGRAVPVGSGVEGMRLMFERAGLDGDEAVDTIAGILTGTRVALLTPEEHESLLTALTIALLTGYEAARVA